MKLLVFSDSHRDGAAMSQILKQTGKSIDAVAHLGDGWDEIHEIMHLYPSIPLYAVTGNCDWGEGPESLIVSFSSKRIVLAHGHRFGVKAGYLRVSLWAEENEADVCLFGHTHIPDVFYSGKTLMLNPGSVAAPRSGYPACYGIVDVSDTGIVEGRLMGKQNGVYRRL